MRVALWMWKMYASAKLVVKLYIFFSNLIDHCYHGQTHGFCMKVEIIFTSNFSCISRVLYDYVSILVANQIDTIEPYQLI